VNTDPSAVVTMARGSANLQAMQMRRRNALPAHTYALDGAWRPILKDLGVSAADVLRRAGLPDDLLIRQDARLSPAEFHRFWEALDRAVDDPLFPLRLCQAIRSESFSPPLFAALCSPDFVVAAERIATYKALMAPMRLDVQVGRDQLSLELHWLDTDLPPPPSLVITELLFFVSLARTGTRERLCPLRVETSVAVPVAPAYREFLGIAITRGRHHRVSFRLQDARRPFLTSNEGMWAAFEPELRTRLAQLDATVTLAARVRAVLLEALPSGQLAMVLVARKLAMSKRTLQRQLEAEGTTYMQLLQQTRESLARHYLHRTTLPATEISFLLGFEEPNSFYRAFREWTGSTPDHVRQAARAKPVAERRDSPSM
jgi:AraC-like DNA-binding protein